MALAIPPPTTPTELLHIHELHNETVWYNEILEKDLARLTTLGPASVSIGNPIIKQLFNEWGKGKWRSFFEHSTEVQCRAAGAHNQHTCYICGFPIRNKNGAAVLGSQCEHIIACVQLILLCGLAGKEWDESIDIILDALGIDETTKEAYKEWRAGIVGRAGVMGASGPAGEGGGKIGIVYLYAHPACNSLKDNDPFIRIKFNADGTITILCTAVDHYNGLREGMGIQNVVPPTPNPTNPWDPRDHIPAPMGETMFERLNHADIVPENLGKIYSSICWKNIYWLLCSLVGYNLILKTQVRALTHVAAAEKTISDGGSKTVDWRKAVFAPWTGSGSHAEWNPGDELDDSHTSIFGNNQHNPYLESNSSLLAPIAPVFTKGGDNVYNHMPLVIDAVYKGFVTTEAWIKRRADRIGEHLKPLIKNIQTPVFEANSKQFGLISALVFAHRIDRKIKNEKAKFAMFEQDEIKSSRPYKKGILSIKFQSEMLNIMVATANAHNFEIASTAATAAAGGWKGWLSSNLPLVAVAGTAAVAAAAMAGSLVGQVGGGDPPVGMETVIPDGELLSWSQIFDAALKIIKLQDMTTWETWDSAFRVFSNYGWIPDEDYNEILREATSLYGTEAFPIPKMVSFFEETKEKLIADINKVGNFFRENPDEVDKFYANFGRLYTDSGGLKVIVGQNNGAGNFTQYITATREQIMEEGLKEFVIETKWFQELKAQMLTMEMDKGFIDQFLFETYNFLDLNNKLAAAQDSGQLSAENFEKLSASFIEYFPGELTSQAVSEGLFSKVVVAYNNLLNYMIGVDESSLGEGDPRRANDVIDDMILIYDLFNMYESNEGEEFVMNLDTHSTPSVQSQKKKMRRTSTFVGLSRQSSNIGKNPRGKDPRAKKRTPLILQQQAPLVTGAYGGGGGQSVRSKKKSKRKNKRKSGHKNRKSKSKKTIRRNNIRNNTRSKKRSQKRSQKRK